LEKFSLREVQVGSKNFENTMACHKMVCGEERVVKLLCELFDVFQLRCEMEAEKQRALQELEEQMRLELQELSDKHKQTISEIKKKQWVCISLAHVIFILECECCVINLKIHVRGFRFQQQ
jgi:hypothetical protein